jgi:uncharacterized protein (TIGR02099 family)
VLTAGILLGVVKLLLRFALIAGILAYFLAAAVLLVTRYWVLPKVDQWRPEIEQAISQAVGTQVKFDAIQADWHGLNANLKITNLTIFDRESVAQLGVPNTEAIVSWRSLFTFEPVFRYIGVENVSVVARRTPDGKTYIGGFEIGADDQAQTNIWHSAAARWLLKQGRINVEDARLVWVDQQRNAVPLVIEDIDLTLDNSLLAHKLDLKASLPTQWGGRLEAVAEVDSVQSSLSQLFVAQPDGYAYVSVTELYPQAIKPWVDMGGLPDVSGSLAARVWVDLISGKFTNLTASVAGRDTQVKQAGQFDDWIRMGQFRWQASGPLAMLGLQEDFPDLIDSPRVQPRFSSRFSVQDGYLSSPAAGMAAIRADQLSVDLSLSKSQAQGLRVDVRDLAFSNDDGLITARGSWVDDRLGAGGLLDVQGTLARFKLPQLYRYLPDDIGQDVHDWLASAFISGMVPRASFEVKGSVDDFPYSASRGVGTFRVDGNVQDLTLNYVPNLEPDELPWPLLTNLNGTLGLLNDEIRVTIEAGALTLPKGERINLTGLSARIEKFEDDAQLTLESGTNAPAQNYLALFKDTALRDVAPDFVHQLTGAGDWSMPLSLEVPLADAEQTKFRGELSFNGGSVSHADGPMVTELQGAAVLTQGGFESRSIVGQLLGGGVKIEGGLNDKLDKLKVDGELAWAELAKFAGSKVLGDWVQGKLPYAVEISMKDDVFKVSAESDLRGTAILLPAPLGLAANQTAATRLQWQGLLDGSKPNQLTASVANRLSMIAQDTLGSSQKSSPRLQSLSLALGSAKPLTGSGFIVAAELPEVVLDDWMPVVQILSQELQAPNAAQSALFPPLTTAQLKTKQFVMGKTHFEDITADLSVKNGRQYVLNLKSTQTSGSAHWAVSQGALQDGFVVKLDQLHVGNQTAEKVAEEAVADLTKSPDVGALSNLPQMDIEVDDLTLHDVRLGKFKLVGRNSPDRQAWQIRQLQIINPHAQLDATGRFRFDSKPGMELDASLKVANLGEMTTYMGQGDQVRNGRGTLTAKIDWLAFPWRIDYSGLTGNAELALEEGVFDHVSSNSARMLELLSLQSLSRILNVNINPDETFEKGFPWNSIDGSFDIKQGLVQTQNLDVNSPVATISLTGDSNLVTETWDLQAVVRPNLDLSGTALATGFLVNPIIGLGALIGQYVLRNPVEAALSQRYSVSGPWADPKITAGSATDSSEPATQGPEIVN